MKTLMTILIILLSISLSYAQELFPINSKWNNLKFIQSSSTIDNEVLIITDEVNFNDLSYKKISRYINENIEEMVPFGYLREEDNKIYFRPDSAIHDYLIYDFNVKINDTVTVYSISTINDESSFQPNDFVVTKVDSFILFNTYTLSNINSEIDTDIWIENIGNLFGFLHCNTSTERGDIYELLCYNSSDGFYEFHNANYDDCDYKLTSSTLDNTEIIKIYPNPVVDKSIIQISNDNFQVNDLYIFNECGEIVLKDKIKKHYEISIHDLEAGIYIIQITNSINKKWTKKIIVR